jgi:hypothetical protein
MPAHELSLRQGGRAASFIDKPTSTQKKVFELLGDDLKKRRFGHLIKSKDIIGVVYTSVFVDQREKTRA